MRALSAMCCSREASGQGGNLKALGESSQSLRPSHLHFNSVLKEFRHVQCSVASIQYTVFNTTVEHLSTTLCRIVSRLQMDKADDYSSSSSVTPLSYVCGNDILLIITLELLWYTKNVCASAMSSYAKLHRLHSTSHWERVTEVHKLRHFRASDQNIIMYNSFSTGLTNDTGDWAIYFSLSPNGRCPISVRCSQMMASPQYSLTLSVCIDNRRFLPS